MELKRMMMPEQLGMVRLVAGSEGDSVEAATALGTSTVRVETQMRKRARVKRVREKAKRNRFACFFFVFSSCPRRL